MGWIHYNTRGRICQGDGRELVDRIGIDKKLVISPNSVTTKLWQNAESSEVKKVEKKPLTIGGRSAIICEHWTRGARERRGRGRRTVYRNSRKNREKSWKTFEKPLDKRKEMWYNRRVAFRKEASRKDHEKSWKTFEKPLDKWKEMWYNSRALPPSG